MQDTEMLQAEYVRVPMADSTLIPTPDSVTDKEALLVGDVLPTGNACTVNGNVMHVLPTGDAPQLPSSILTCFTLCTYHHCIYMQLP